MKDTAGWRFGAFEFDPETGRLWQAGEPVPIAAKPAALLHHLLRRAGSVVSKRELAESVWPDTRVSEAAFLSAVRDLRRCLGESAAGARWIETLRGRGLRFAGDAQEPSRAEAASPTPSDDPWSGAAEQLDEALRALDLVEGSRGPAAMPSRERRALLIALARARWAMGAPGDARTLFREAAEAARRTGDAEVLARAALGLAGRTDAAATPNPEAVVLLEESITAVDDSDPALRAELKARLGTELAGDSTNERADALTQAALGEAETLEDPTLLAYALTARHFVLHRPDVDPKERSRLADRAIALVGQSRSSDVLAIALQERLFDALESGDGEGVEATFRRYSTMVEELAEPFFRWMRSAFAGSLALLTGDVDRAETLASETLALGEQVGTENAAAMYAAQLFGLREAQGRLAELYPLLRGQAAAPGSSPGFRAAAVASAVAAEADDAEPALAAMLSDLDDAPRDRNWLPLLGVLTPPIVTLRHRAGARKLLEAYQAYAGRVVVAAHGALVLGAVNHHLGRLHGVLGERPSAKRRLRAAQAEHRALRTTAWSRRTIAALEDARAPG